MSVAKRPEPRGDLPLRLVVPLLLARTTLRHARLAWRQSLAIVCIVALGVGVVLAVRLANRAAAASFTHFTDAVAGSSDWIVRPAAGDFRDELLPRVREALGTQPAVLFPVLETTAAEPAQTGATEPGWGRASYQMLGIDLVALRNLADVYGSGRSLMEVPEEFAPVAGEAVARERFWRVLEGDRGVFVSARAAREHAWRIGSPLKLIVGDRLVDFEIAGILPQLEGNPEPATNLLVMDIAALQRVTGRVGELDRLEVWAEPGPGGGARRERLRSTLETLGAGRWVVESPQASRRTGETMTAAFRLNLSVLSLLALAVGAFLVVEALDGAVVRRRQEIAILRSLGVPPRAVQAAWLAESAVYGAVGALLGVGLGALGAQTAVQLVGRTVNALYFQTTVDAATLQSGEVITALVLGLAASVFAGWLPARAAAATPPAELLPRGRVAAGAGWSLKLWPGFALVAAGIFLQRLPPLALEGGGHFPLAGYAAAVLWLAAAAWLSPGLLGVCARLARPCVRDSAVLRLALSRFWRPSGRHRLAVAGLVVAVGMTASMAVMISSFETTVRGWIGNVLQADLFIASEGAQSASSENRLAPETWRALTTDADVADSAVLHGQRIVWRGLPTFLSGTDFGFLARHGSMTWIEKPGIWPPAETSSSEVDAVVSEAFVNRFSVRVGDRLEVPAEPAVLRVRVTGVFADYGNERGTLMIPAEHYRTALRDERAATVTLVLLPGISVDSTQARLQAANPALRVHSQASLRAQVFRIFNQTFAITYALEVVGLFVALIGLGLSLASVLLDRRDEQSTLRALGMTRDELARAAAWEGAIVAGASALGGSVLSGALGWLLIHVINRQSFGWTLQFAPPPVLLCAFAVVVTACGWGVCWLVGRGGAVVAAEREE